MSYTQPQFSHLRFRPFSFDWSIAFVNGNKNLLYIGFIPALNYSFRRDNGSFYFHRASVGYLQCEVPIGNTLFVSSRVSSRMNVGLAINHKLKFRNNCYVESMIGLSSHAFNIPSLVYGFSLNFQLD
jgi:hypothetical protein